MPGLLLRLPRDLLWSKLGYGLSTQEMAMFNTRAFAAGITMFGLVMAAGSSAQAQAGPGGLINPGRDCQTVVQCRFRRGGVYRGCISAYSCRRCRFVRANCTIEGRRRQTCRQLRCTWD